MTAITFYIDDDDLEKINLLRKEYGVTNKYLLNTALEHFLAKRGFDEE